VTCRRTAPSPSDRTSLTFSFIGRRRQRPGRVVPRRGALVRPSCRRWDGRRLPSHVTSRPSTGLRSRGKAPVQAPFDLDGTSFGFLLGDHVSTTDGTGLVHTAPGHGREDYDVVRRSGFSVDDPASAPSTRPAATTFTPPWISAASGSSRPGAPTRTRTRPSRGARRGGPSGVGSSAAPTSPFLPALLALQETRHLPATHSGSSTSARSRNPPSPRSATGSRGSRRSGEPDRRDGRERLEWTISRQRRWALPSRS